MSFTFFPNIRITFPSTEEILIDKGKSYKGSCVQEGEIPESASWDTQKCAAAIQAGDQIQVRRAVRAKTARNAGCKAVRRS